MSLNGELRRDRRPRSTLPLLVLVILAGIACTGYVGYVVVRSRDASQAQDLCSTAPPATATPVAVAYLKACAVAVPSWKVVDAALDKQNSRATVTDVRRQADADRRFVQALRRIRFPQAAKRQANELVRALNAYIAFLDTARTHPGYLENHLAQSAKLNADRMRATVRLRRVLQLPPDPCIYRRP